MSFARKFRTLVLTCPQGTVSVLPVHQL